MAAFSGGRVRAEWSSLWIVVLGAMAFAAESCSGADADGGGSGGAFSGGAANVGGARSAGGGGVGGTGNGSGGRGAGGAAGETGSAGSAAGGRAGSGSGGSPATNLCKRGVAYGHHSAADLAALSPGISFWYNWDFRPDTALRDGSYRDLSVEYVPMIWGAGSDREAAMTAIPDGATALLGFNEPNFGSQANMSAVDAAALWPKLEEIAEARSLRLVSPAVNFCGGDCQDTDPFHYLDEFFESCDGCRVDAIAMHIYVGCTPSGANKAEWLKNHVETYKSRFALPLWLTEFACDNAKNFGEQEAFLKDAVAYLEAEPRIERYAWFAGRADNMAFVDLLGEDGELTSLGSAYVNAAKNPECER